MTSAKNHRMAGPRFRCRMPIVGFGEDGAAIQKHLQAAFVERRKARQIIETHLIDGEDQNELWLGGRSLTEGQETEAADQDDESSNARNPRPIHHFLCDSI